jgi:hypothetical protein
MCQYLKRRFRWSDEEIDNIDWDAKAAAMMKLKSPDQRFACKLGCDWLPLGKRQKQAKLNERAECPRCSHATEDLDHLLRCPKASEWRKEFQRKLREHLEELQTERSIREEIIGGVSSWFTQSEHDPGPQTQVGWRAFLQGYISSHWNH